MMMMMMMTMVIMMMMMVKMANHLYPEKAVYPVRAFLVSTKLPRTSCSQTRSSWSSLDRSFKNLIWILGEDDHSDDDDARWSTCVSRRTMLLLAEFPLFLWLRSSSMIIIIMDIAIMVVMIVTEYIMSLLSTRFPFLELSPRINSASDWHNLVAVFDERHPGGKYWKLMFLLFSATA